MTSLAESLRPTTVRRSLFCTVFLLLSYWVHFWPTFHAANESIRLYFVQAVVDYGSASVDEPRQRYGMTNVDKAHYQGHDYMDKAPGLSLLVIPVYWIATRIFGMSTEFSDLPNLSYLLLLFGVVIPGTLGAYAVYRVIQSRAGPSKPVEEAALFGAIIVGLASPYALYCTLFFGHGPAAALGAMSIAMLNRQRYLAGMLAGAMVLVDTPAAVLAFGLGIWVLIRTRSLRAMIEFGIGGIPPIAIQLAYNTWLFDSPFTFAYAHKASGDLATIHAQGLFGFSIPTIERLYGLSFGSERGLFFHAPVLLLAFFGGPRAKPFLVLSLVYFLWIAAFVDWQAGASYAPRHLTPVVPLLAIAAALSLLQQPKLRVIAPALLVYSALVTFSMISTFPYAMIPFDAPILEQALPMLGSGAISPNILGLTSYMALLPPIGLAVLLCGLLSVRRSLLAGFVGLACFLMLAAAPVPLTTAAKIDSLTRATAFNGYAPVAKNICHSHNGYRWIERAWACVPKR
ncbi:MAG: hypothetical protein VX223_07035 [Myxococcota bacterium]|nr:hypothetical protein [Myxococcota bacterium]